MNIVAYFHAYKFTHFQDNYLIKTEIPEKLSPFDKLRVLFFGVDNPRPSNTSQPRMPFESLKLRSNKEIECWYVHRNSSTEKSSSRGTVIIFHGYAGEKSSMLDRSEEFAKLGFNTFLVDFMGSGGSEGNQTTLGFTEAEEVKTAYDYVLKRGEKSIYLFGTSMGAVAILKALSDYNIEPRGIILECPFGSMYQTTCARFKSMNLPTFPMAGLLVFWGGVQNGFWALKHNPLTYATKVMCPTLLLYGEQDRNVSQQEINDIYKNLKGEKTLRTYKLAGHENYLLKYKQEWTDDISEFLNK
ncbi:alpha/beta hydrolase [Dyadobacter sp. CY326]|uniref:alpha/beta hydrolase n=1 Tax=Dyadobacter sp. CY326 TaxID=2907300 RepID=UPI001F2540AA|nr:alpha/beta fold hydrolase [Dyadobacter sp. CY326]MCE7065297.1 lysophospholipase [Dyadobacter sp. CY326]